MLTYMICPLLREIWKISTFNICFLCRLGQESPSIPLPLELVWCSLLSRIFRWEKKKEEEITLKFQFICFLSRAGRNRVRFLLIIHNYIRNLRLQRENQKKKYLSISRERKKLRREERKREHFHCINRISHEIFPHQKKTIDEFFVFKKKKKKFFLLFFVIFYFSVETRTLISRARTRERRRHSLSLSYFWDSVRVEIAY